MIYIVLNALQILAAAIAGVAFGAAWHALAGRRDAPLGSGFFALACVAETWLAAILAGAMLLAPAKADGWVMAIGTAVVIWLGFVVPAVAVTLRYRGVRAAAMAGDCVHWLGVMVVQAVVLHTLGLRLPHA